MHGQHILTDYFYQMTLRDDKIFQAKDELPQNRLTDSMILGACVDDDDDGACWWLQYIAIYNIQYTIYNKSRWWWRWCLLMMMPMVPVDGYNMQMVAIIHVNPLRPAPLSW